MPKRKKDEEDEEDEPLSDEEDEKPKKKKKEPKKKAEPKKKQKKADDENEGNEAFIDLGGKKRVTVRKFKGNTYIDIREFYGVDEGDLKPGKKGISLSTEAWAKLKEHVSEIDELVSKIDS